MFVQNSHGIVVELQEAMKLGKHFGFKPDHSLIFFYIRSPCWDQLIPNLVLNISLIWDLIMANLRDIFGP